MSVYAYNVCRFVGVGLVVGLILAAAGGCEKRHRQITVTDPVVSWEQLEVGRARGCAQEGFRLLTDETVGLFPTALAVARVKASYPNQNAPQPVLQMDMTAEGELLPWNSTFDDQRVISGAFPIKEIALQGQEVTAELLWETSEAMRAKLCLIYTTSSISKVEAQVHGALYDAREGKPVAVMLASANSEELEEMLAEMPEHVRRDKRYANYRALAAYKFRCQVREAAIALRKQDQPLEGQSPEGWLPPPRPMPEIWFPPPRQYRQGDPDRMPTDDGSARPSGDLPD